MKKRRKIIDMDMLEIWNQVLENLEGNVSPVGFNIHIKRVRNFPNSFYLVRT